MHPASVQKIFTIPISVEKLGDNYKFKTILFKRDDKSYVIRLGADPYLSSKDLKQLTTAVSDGSIAATVAIKEME